VATYGGIRGLAQAFLRSAAERGLSANEAINAMKAGGLGTYRRQEMLTDYRQFLGVPKKADVLKNVRKDYRPSEDLFTPTKGYQRSVYRYQVNVAILNPETGEGNILSTNIATELPLTVRQAESAAVDHFIDIVDRYKNDIVDVELYAVFEQAG
jgi:hypothetical protein